MQYMLLLPLQSPLCASPVCRSSGPPRAALSVWIGPSCCWPGTPPSPLPCSSFWPPVFSWPWAVLLSSCLTWTLLWPSLLEAAPASWCWQPWLPLPWALCAILASPLHWPVSSSSLYSSSASLCAWPASLCAPSRLSAFLNLHPSCRRPTINGPKNTGQNLPFSCCLSPSCSFPCSVRPSTRHSRPRTLTSTRTALSWSAVTPFQSARAWS